VRSGIRVREEEGRHRGREKVGEEKLYGEKERRYVC